MKIRNLYIGEVLMISEKSFDEKNDIDTITNYYTTHSRNSIFYKLDSKRAKDIVYGGIYKVGFSDDLEVGDEFIRNLKNKPVLNFLNTNNYNKNSITKRKILKLISDASKKGNM